jgi:hypothetical protein
MLTDAILFMCVVGALGVGGLLGLASLVVMAIEVHREGF